MIAYNVKILDILLLGSQTELCSCIKQKIYNIEYNRSNIGNVNKENFETFDLNKYSDEVYEEKYSSKVSPRENIKVIKEIAENFIKNFENPDEKNLLFCGYTGLGKTFLSNCIANELLKNGETVLYQTAPVMLDSILDYRFNKKGNNSFNVIENLLNVDLLIIDDLGTETLNELKFTELFTIINSRLLNQNQRITKTIISTNLTIQNIFDVYEERLRFKICWKLPYLQVFPVMISVLKNDFFMLKICTKINKKTVLFY